MSVSAFAQRSLSEVQMDRLPKVVQKMLTSNNIDLDRYSKSREYEANILHYNRHIRQYEINMNPKELFATYANVSPKEAWNSKRAKLAMGYFDDTETIKYADKDEFGPIQVGDLYFLQLDVHLGKVPVAFEISVVDHVNRIIRFNYLKQNKSNGLQTLYFMEHETDPNKTILNHISYFKSDSRFRDKNAYIPFHNILIDDFHRNHLERLSTDVKENDRISVKILAQEKDFLDKDIYKEETQLEPAQ